MVWGEVAYKIWVKPRLKKILCPQEKKCGGQKLLMRAKGVGPVKPVRANQKEKRGKRQDASELIRLASREIFREAVFL